MPSIQKLFGRIRRQLRYAVDALQLAYDTMHDRDQLYSALRNVQTQLSNARHACQVGLDLASDFTREVPEALIDNAPEIR